MDSLRQKLKSLNTEHDSLLNKKPDTSVADSLRLELEKLQAEHEALLNKKPDTTEVEALKTQLETLHTQHETALSIAQQESAQATKEHLAAKEALEKVEADFSEHKNAMEIKHKTTETDFKDMHSAMTQLVEEANKKAEEASKRAMTVESHVAELEAQLKVKEAELAEAKAATAAASQAPITPIPKPSPKSGLAASRFAEELDEDEPVAAPINKSEGEPDSSSAALASLAAAKMTASQLDDMNNDLNEDNLRMIKSMADVTSTGVAEGAWTSELGPDPPNKQAR